MKYKLTPEHKEKMKTALRLKRAARTHCVNGHLYTETSTGVYRGSRFCKICRYEKKKISGVKWYKKAGKGYMKNKSLKKLYSITLEDYNRMYDEQNGRCKICRRHSAEFVKGLAVDHCHITGKVRGLLCGNCNTGIGNLKDDILILKSAIEYLENGKT